MTSIGEKRLQKRFENLLKDDFDLFPEVWGKNLVYPDKEVRIDYLLFPKPHLIEAGFDPVWFGVEIKHFGKPGETGKLSRLIWQCITYVQSQFELDKKNIRPVFVLSFSDFQKMNKGNGNEYISQWLGMIRLGGLAKVGILNELEPSAYQPIRGWSIVFSSSTYFSFSKGEYHRKNYNIFNINIGNSTN
ncbi:MAG: hypothetical protein R3D55_07335 [Chloroflexota bacterium]